MEFLKIDDSYLKRHKVLETEKTPLGKGNNGVVYGVKGNNRLVIKQDIKNSRAWDSIDGEMKVYNKYHLDKEPLFSPSKKVNVKSGKTGIARPKVTPMFDPNTTQAKYFTPSFIARLKKAVIILSYDKLVLGDGVQIGYDKFLRVMQYDMGGVHKVSSINIAFQENNKMWKELGHYLRKDVGSIKRTPELDRQYLKAGLITKSRSSR